MTKEGKRIVWGGLFVGAALLSFYSILDYADRSPHASVETGTGAMMNCAATQDSQCKPPGLGGRFKSCVDCGVADQGSSNGPSVEKLMKYPPCMFRALTDPCHLRFVPVFVVFVAILMEQSISGFRGGFPLALVLSGLSVFGAVYLAHQDAEPDLSTYVALVLLAALFGGAVAHWTIYIRDLLPVVALGSGLYWLHELPSGTELFGNREYAAWAAGLLGGGWLFWWRNRSKSTNERPKSDETTATVDKSTAP